MIRATTGGVLRSYRTNLMNSFIAVNKARETVLTQRVFNSYAEDPAAAAKAFRLRKSRMMTSSQLKICDDVYHKYNSAFACLQTVSELIDTQNSSSNISTLKSTTLKMLNDPTGDARTQLNKVLDNLSDTIVQNMNQTYGDEFIFAGADGHNVPFTVEELADGTKQLCYRGIPVDSAEPNVMKFNTTGDPNIAKPCLAPDGTFGHTSATNAYQLYLNTDNITPMPLTEYERLYTLPKLQESTGGGTPTFTEYNEDGSLYTGAFEEFGGYYLKLDSNGDPTDPTVADNLIRKSDYNAAVDSQPTLLSWGNFANLGATSSVGTDLGGQPVLFIDNPNAGYGVQNSFSINDFFASESKDRYCVMIVNGDPKDQGITKEEYDKACKNAEKLDYLAGEKRFVDIGLGFKEDENGKLIESSAFNECLSGLTFLGHGVDEDGDPKNIYSIVQRLKDIAASVPEEGQWDKTTWDEFDRLVGKLEAASSEFKTQFTNQSAGTEKLKNNYDLLEDNVYNLKEQYSNLEDVNMADAITSFIWAEYCYNAALKVGNSILSQSLMDYLQ